VVVGIRGVFHTDTGHKVTRHQKYEIAAKANFICRWIRWAIDIEIIIGDICVGATGGEAVNEIPRGAVCLPYLPGGTAYPNPFRRFVITGSGFYQHNGNRCSSVCSGAAAQRQGAADEIVIFLVRNFPGGDHFRLCQGQGSAEREKVILLPQSQIFIPLLMSQPWDLPGEIELRVGGFRYLADLPRRGAEAQDDQRSRHEHQQHQDDHQSNPPSPPPGRRRGGGALGGLRCIPRRRLRRLRQLRHADAEFPGQGQQILYVRRRSAGLPFAHRLAAHPQPGPQLLLGDAQGFAVRTDPLSQRHGHIPPLPLGPA